MGAFEQANASVVHCSQMQRVNLVFPLSHNLSKFSNAFASSKLQRIYSGSTVGWQRIGLAAGQYTTNVSLSENAYTIEMAYHI